MLSILIFTEVLLLILTTYMMITSNTAMCVVISNIISAVMVFIYCVLQAPDIAITEAVIGTSTSTILFSLSLLYIKRMQDYTEAKKISIDVRQKLFVFILCCLLFMLLLFIHRYISLSIQASNKIFDIGSIYIKNAINDFGFESIVTAVVAGYRAFDTMFENVVIFTACYGFYILLTMDKDDNKINSKDVNKYE